MAKRNYGVDVLSISSIEQLKKELNSYRNTFTQKCRILVDRLIGNGIDIAQIKVSESPLGKYITLRAEVDNVSSGAVGSIIGVGAIKQADEYEDFNILLAVEFGAGIHHNAKANPKAAELGFGVGTFPGQTHAFQDSWWYWDAKDEKWKRTYGIKATMPMYSAFLEMYKIAQQTAIEVFR